MTDFFETCIISGARSIKSESVPEMLVNLDMSLGLLISQNVTCFRVIPTPGFNFYAALSVLNLKRLFPEAELEVFTGKFTDNLSEPNKAVREFIIANADRIIDAEGAKNAKELISFYSENASRLLCFGENDTGFSSRLVEYARANRFEIIQAENTSVSVET